MTSPLSQCTRNVLSPVESNAIQCVCCSFPSKRMLDRLSGLYHTSSIGPNDPFLVTQLVSSLLHIFLFLFGSRTPVSLFLAWNTWHVDWLFISSQPAGNPLVSVTSINSSQLSSSFPPSNMMVHTFSDTGSYYFLEEWSLARNLR